jgi:hypothetical protein
MKGPWKAFFNRATAALKPAPFIATYALCCPLALQLLLGLCCLHLF